MHVRKYMPLLSEMLVYHIKVEMNKVDSFPKRYYLSHSESPSTSTWRWYATIFPSVLISEGEEWSWPTHRGTKCTPFLENLTKRHILSKKELVLYTNGLCDTHVFNEKLRNVVVNDRRNKSKKSNREVDVSWGFLVNADAVRFNNDCDEICIESYPVLEANGDSTITLDISTKWNFIRNVSYERIGEEKIESQKCCA